jgi:hypothetical protein
MISYYMRVFFSFILFITTAYNASAQPGLPWRVYLDSIRQHYWAEEMAYNCEKDEVSGLKARAINSASFDSLFKVIVSRVVVNSEDLVRNGKAVNVSFTELTKKISLNYNWEYPKGEEKYLNFGFNAENASSSFFEFVGKDGYTQGWGISGSRTRQLGKRTIYFMPDACSTLQVNRKKEFVTLLSRYDSLLALAPQTLADLRTRVAIYERRTITNMSTTQNILDSVAASFPNEQEYKKAKDILNRRDSLDKYSKPDSVGRYHFEEVYTADLVAFEKTNFKEYGFGINWVNYGLAADFKTFSIYDTAAVRLAEP